MSMVLKYVKIIIKSVMSVKFKHIIGSLNCLVRVFLATIYAIFFQNLDFFSSKMRGDMVFIPVSSILMEVDPLQLRSYTSQALSLIYFAIV